MNFYSDILRLFSIQALQKIVSADSLNLAQYSAFTTILIQNGIPFDVEYTPCNRRDSTQLTVTVYLSPNVTVDFSFSDLDLSEAP